MGSTIAFLRGMIVLTVSATWVNAATADSLKVAVAQRGFWTSSFIEFALQQGFFKQEGLDIEILYTEGGASTLTPVGQSTLP
jgi:NitT/TauT family transport system substrate-binding protein